MLERNPRAAGRYVIDFVPNPTLPAGVRLEWTARPEWDDWARWSKGCYVLRTNIADWSADDLWRTYIQLTDAEAAFVKHRLKRTPELSSESPPTEVLSRGV